MANEQITSPILLDSTGVAIKNAIQQVANNVKPDATEINMGPNDSTKVSAAMASLSEQMANYHAHTLIFSHGNFELIDNAEITLTNDLSNYREIVFIYRYAATGIFYQRSFYIADTQYMMLDTYLGADAYAYLTRVSGSTTKLKVLGGGTYRPFLTKIYGVK